MKRIVVVEGLSGSGKSTFSKFLAETLSLEYVNLDMVAKECYKEEIVLDSLKNIFYDDIFYDDMIDFKKLGKVVFNDSNKMKKLENILYPVLVVKVKNIILNSKNGCVLDGIKVHETELFDEACLKIFIKRDNGKRISSLIKRDGISKESAMKRDNVIDFSGIKFDYVIENNGNLLDLKKEVPFVVSKIIDGDCCLYAGSFDPFTNGHLELVRRASNEYDFIFIGIGDNANKKRNYDKDDMVCLINEVLKKENIYNALCFEYKGFTGEIANKLGVKDLVRGIRNDKDRDEEKIVEKYNYEHFNLKTKYYMIKGLECVSSTSVKERLKDNLSISDLVPDLIEKYLINNKDL